MTARKRMSPKVLIPLLVGVCLVCHVALVAVVRLSLRAARNTEQAQVAYEYVVSSNVFATAGLDSDDLRLKEYSLKHTITDGEKTSTAEITFTARESLFRKYTFHVICHQENDAWRVCDECSYITASGVGKEA